MGLLDCVDEHVPFLAVDEMRLTPAVRGPEVGHPFAADLPGYRTLCLDVRRFHRDIQSRGRVAEQVVDVPVSDVALAAGDLAVAVDPTDSGGCNFSPTFDGTGHVERRYGLTTTTMNPPGPNALPT